MATLEELRKYKQKNNILTSGGNNGGATLEDLRAYKQKNKKHSDDKKNSTTSYRNPARPSQVPESVKSPTFDTMGGIPSAAIKSVATPTPTATNKATTTPMPSATIKPVDIITNIQSKLSRPSQVPETVNAPTYNTMGGMESTAKPKKQFTETENKKKKSGFIGLGTIVNEIGKKASQGLVELGNTINPFVEPKLVMYKSKNLDGSYEMIPAYIRAETKDRVSLYDQFGNEVNGRANKNDVFEITSPGQKQLVETWLSNQQRERSIEAAQSQEEFEKKPLIEQIADKFGARVRTAFGGGQDLGLSKQEINSANFETSGPKIPENVPIVGGADVIGAGTDLVASIIGLAGPGTQGTNLLSISNKAGRTAMQNIIPKAVQQQAAKKALGSGLQEGLKTVAARTATGAVEGAGTMPLLTTYNGVMQGKSPDEILKDIPKEMGAGAAFGAAFNNIIPTVSKVFENIKRKASLSKGSNINEPVVLPEGIKSDIYTPRELPLPQKTVEVPVKNTVNKVTAFRDKPYTLERDAFGDQIKVPKYNGKNDWELTLDEYRAKFMNDIKQPALTNSKEFSFDMKAPSIQDMKFINPKEIKKIQVKYDLMMKSAREAAYKSQGIESPKNEYVVANTPEIKKAEEIYINKGHEITKQMNKDLSDLLNSEIVKRHKLTINNAIDNGYNISDSVLSEYPILKKKYDIIKSKGGVADETGKIPNSTRNIPTQTETGRRYEDKTGKVYFQTSEVQKGTIAKDVPVKTSISGDMSMPENNLSLLSDGQKVNLKGFGEVTVESITGDTISVRQSNNKIRNIRSDVFKKLINKNPDAIKPEPSNYSMPNFEDTNIPNPYKSIAESTGLYPTAELSVKPSDIKSSSVNSNLMTGDTRPGMKQSQFAANTLLRSIDLPDNFKTNLKLNEFDYVPETSAEWQEIALKNIENNESKVMQDIYDSPSISGGVQAHEAAIITKKLIIEAKNAESINKLREWLQTVGDKTRETARALKGTDTAWEKKSPEGMLIKAEREVKKVEDNLKDENPKLIDDINKETDDLVNSTKKIDDDAIDKISKEAEKFNKDLSPAEMLAKRIETYVSPKSSAETNLIKKMVDDLFNKATKESPIKSKSTKASSDAYSPLARAMTNNGKYAETWNKAKEILKETFKDDSEILKSLENYFNKGIKPPFAISKMDAAIKDALKNKGINLSDVVKDYYKTNQNIRGDLKEFIINKTGLDGIEADRLAKYFDNRFKELTKSKKEEILKSWFKTKGAQSKSGIKKINELTNLGAFVNENYKNAVMDKVTPIMKQLISENKINLNELVRKGFDVTDMTKSNFVKAVQSGLKISQKDWKMLSDIARSEFDKLAAAERDKILNNMFKTKIPKPQKSMYDKVMELINLGAYDRDSIRDLIKQKNNLPVLDNNDVKYILKTMSAAEKLEAGSYAQRVLQAKAIQRIADKIPTGFVDKFQALQRISMLLNPKTTLIRNPLGNTFLGAAETVKDAPGILIDKATSKVLGSERTKIFAPKTKLEAEIKGTAKGLKEWALDIKNGVDTSYTEGGVELPHSNKIFNENVQNSVLQTVNKSANNVHGMVSKMLRMGDTPFFNGAYERRLAELKKIKNTTEVTDAMKEEARRFALERTLQDDSSISKTLLAGKRGDWIKNPGSKLAWRLITNLILPFAKTPGNIVNKFIEYSPGGAVKAFGHVGMSFRKGTFNQRYFVDNLARSFTGTGLTLVGYLLAKNGIITGAPSKDKKISAVETALGKQDYAFKIGNNYHAYDWAQPAAAPLAMGADIFNAVNNTKDGKNAALNGLESSINLLFRSTVLQGPSKLMGGYSPAVSMGDSLLNSSTQFTPTGSKQIAQLIDPTQRETYDPSTVKETLNKTIARIPGLSKTLPEKLNVFGEIKNEDNPLTNALNVLVNPGSTTEYNPTEMQKELIRLYEEGGQTDHLPSAAEKFFLATKKHPKIILTAKEYTDYQRKIGQEITKQFEAKINTQLYKKADDEEKSSMLAQIIKDVKSSAKDQIIGSRMIQEFEEQYSKTKNIKNDDNKFKSGVTAQEVQNYIKLNKANDQISLVKSRTDKLINNDKLTKEQKEKIKERNNLIIADIAIKALNDIKKK